MGTLLSLHVGATDDTGYTFADAEVCGVRKEEICLLVVPDLPVVGFFARILLPDTIFCAELSSLPAIWGKAHK